MMGKLGTWCAAAVWVVAFGCGDKSKEEGQAADQPSAGADEAPQQQAPASDTATASWPAGVVPLSAKWESKGEATKDTVLTGTLYVGPEAVRLDIDNHPNAGHAMSFIREHGEDDLWAIDPEAKSYDRALSGDWEHDVIPTVVDEDDLDDLEACPFGYASDECKRLDAEQVAGHATQKWVYEGRTLWVAPALRVAVKESYTPYRNNPNAQVTTLSEIEPGDQDPGLFSVPADGYTCKAGGFCDGAP